MEVGGWGVLSVVCVKGSQWMSPLIHFLIKQPALCLSHGLYPSPGLVLWADVARIDTHTAALRTLADTQPIALYESKPPPGLDRNNKQQMIHDRDGECIQQDHLSDLI